MAYLSFWERHRIPTYLDPGEITTGKVEFDLEKCTRCGLCAPCCPVGSIIIPEDRTEVPRVKQGGPDIYLCFACGNCESACPSQAVTVERRYNTHTYYNRLCRPAKMTYPKRY